MSNLKVKNVDVTRILLYLQSSQYVLHRKEVESGGLFNVDGVLDSFVSGMCGLKDMINNADLHYYDVQTNTRKTVEKGIGMKFNPDKQQYLLDGYCDLCTVADVKEEMGDDCVASHLLGSGSQSPCLRNDGE